MRLHRFYIEQPLGEEFVVEKSELIHQWTSVFRYTNGSTVVLFSPNTPGIDYEYRITSLTKKAITVTPVAQSTNIIPKRSLTLCLALIKKDAFESVIRQATELGVTRIIPIRAAHSEKKEINMERLLSIAMEAAEQCGRGNVPVISQKMTFDAALQETKGSRNIFFSLLGETSHIPTQNQDTAVWIGPEGGWTQEEEDLARHHGCTLKKLTETVLRADTAAISGLTSVIL